MIAFGTFRLPVATGLSLKSAPNRIRAVAFLILTAILLALSPSAQASIEQAEDSLVGRAEESQIKRLSGDLGYAALSKGKVYLIITAGSSYCKAMVIGYHEDSAEAIAKALDEWAKDNSHPGTVKWSHDDEYSVAALRWSNAHFGASKAQQTIGLGSLIQKVKGAGFTPMTALRVMKYVQHDYDQPADSTSATINYYKLRDDFNRPLTFRASLTGLDSFLIVAFFAWVPVIAFLSFGIAILIGSSQSIAVEKRKRLYTKLVTYPTFGAIGVHAPFAIWMITGSTLRKAGDLWFGSDQVAGYAFPALMLPVLALFAILPLIGKFERKLFGEGQKNSLVEPEKPDPAVLEFNKLKSRVGLVIMAIGVALYMTGAIVLPTPMGDARQILRLLGLFLALFSSSIARLFLKKREAQIVGPGVSERTKAIAAELADQMGARKMPVVVSRSFLTLLTVNASISPWRISVSARAEKTLDDDEMRFLIAHELAHQRLGHLRWRFIVIFLPTTLLLFVPMFLIFTGAVAFGITQMPFVFLIMVGSMMWTLAGTKFMQRKQEFEADELALRTTRDLSAAESLMRKMIVGSGQTYQHEVETLSTHPALSKRLAQLRSIAEKIGIEVLAPPIGTPGPNLPIDS